MRGRGRPSSSRPTGSTALLASLAIHAALLLALVHYLSQDRVFAEAPVMRVVLVPPPLKMDVPEASQPRRTDNVRRGPALPSTARARQLTARDAFVLGDAPIAAEGHKGAELNLPTVLRGFRECERPGLSRDERERCESRRWAQIEPPRMRLNLDVSGRYAENPEPFLSRRPKDGCRPRVTGDVNPTPGASRAPPADTGHARGGATCVFPF